MVMRMDSGTFGEGGRGWDGDTAGFDADSCRQTIVPTLGHNAMFMDVLLV